MSEAWQMSVRKTVDGKREEKRYWDMLGYMGR
jgi:hypothetical protein